jgi:branched-chain amino acid transport system permease protein
MTAFFVRHERFLRGRVAETVLFALVLLVPLIFFSGNPYRIFLSSLMIVYIGAASGLSILLGIARQLHLGQSAFMAIGGYTAGIVSERWGASVPLELGISLVIGGALGFVVGAATLRLSGLYFALATLGLVLGMSSLIGNWDSLTHGQIGFPTVPPARLFGTDLGPIGHYLLVATLLLVQAAVIFCFKRSTYWGALKLIGDKDYLASCVGIRVYRYRVTLMVIVSILGACWGAMYAHVVAYLDPTTFGLVLTIPLLMMVVLGGLGSFWGAIIGAFVLVEIPEWLATVRGQQQLIYGAILLAVILVIPKGLIPSVEAVIGRRRRRNAARKRATSEQEGAGSTLLRASQLTFDGAELHVDHLAMRFGGIHALRDATLVAERGKIEGLIGPNGSGKTTMLNCISGLVRPQEGSIRLDGDELLGLRPDEIARLGLARTFQTPQTVLEMSVLENAVLGWHLRRSTGPVSVGLGLPKSRKEEERQLAEARGLCEDLDLGELLDHPTSELSTGDRRFVEIARALGSRPRLLVLDEPATGMTGLERERLVTILHRLRDAGLTMVVIDHDMEFLFQMADHVTVLDRGANIATGSPDEVRSAPAVISAYFGEPAAHA